MAKKKVKRFPHHKLGISFAEYGALLGTREMLKNGDLVFAKGRDFPLPNIHLFNMSVGMTANAECGSVGCIGGTMGQIMSKDAQEAMDYVYEKDTSGEVLRNLFYMDGFRYKMSTATPKQAIKAIDNFLSGSKTPWKGVLTKAQKTDDDNND